MIKSAILSMSKFQIKKNTKYQIVWNPIEKYQIVWNPI